MRNAPIIEIVQVVQVKLRVVGANHTITNFVLMVMKLAQRIFKINAKFHGLMANVQFVITQTVTRVTEILCVIGV